MVRLAVAMPPYIFRMILCSFVSLLVAASALARSPEHDNFFFAVVYSNALLLRLIYDLPACGSSHFDGSCVPPPSVRHNETHDVSFNKNFLHQGRMIVAWLQVPVAGAWLGLLNSLQPVYDTFQIWICFLTFQLLGTLAALKYTSINPSLYVEVFQELRCLWVYVCLIDLS